MKKVLVIFIAILLFSCLSFSQLSFRFYGGLAHMKSKDICSAVKATNDLLDLYDPGHTGFLEKLCLGANFGGEILYQISHNIGLGIGIEFIRLRNESNLSYSYNMDTPLVQTSTYRFNTIPITFNIHFSRSVTSLLNAYVSVGAGYYLMDINYMSDSLWDFGLLGNNPDQIYSFQSSQGTLGLQAQWGIEVIVSRNISFLVGGMGRFAKISDVKGDWTNTGYTPGIGSFDESGSNHYFWFYEESIEGKNYPQVVFSENAPSFAVNARKGKLDLSGFSFAAGIKIGLDFIKK